MNNIILIGFMGVGKGSVAREVIKHSDYIAMDTDDLIESMENRRIKNIDRISFIICYLIPNSHDQHLYTK